MSTNVVVLIGRLARTPEHHQLPSGKLLVAYEVYADQENERPATIPVVWVGAPPHADDCGAGEQVIVVGRVRRRFFLRAGAIPQSRTEVEADVVISTHHRERADAALHALAQASLDVAETGLLGP